MGAEAEVESTGAVVLGLLCGAGWGWQGCCEGSVPGDPLCACWGLTLGVRSPPGRSVPVVNQLHMLPTVSSALTSKLRSCFGITLESER